MDQKNWITKANKMLKEYPGMSKDEVIKTLKDQGFARPTGIEGRDSRSFKKKHVLLVVELDVKHKKKFQQKHQLKIQSYKGS